MSVAERSERMRRVRQRGTALELLVRRGLHRRGLRFRLGNRQLPGSPDIVLPSRRSVVFVHGCFWHAHDCRLGRRPSSNISYWKEKAEENRARDARQVATLAKLGWHVFVVWQCELASQEMREMRLDRLAASIRQIGQERIPRLIPR